MFEKIKKYLELFKLNDKTDFKFNQFIIGNTLFNIIEIKEKNKVINNPIITKFLLSKFEVYCFSSYEKMELFFEYFDIFEDKAVILLIG